MNKEKLLDTIKEIISQEIEADIQSITLDTSFETLNVDSLDVMKLALIFETKFQITITTAELERIRTVEDIFTNLQTKLASKE